MTRPKVLFLGDLNRDLPEYVAFATKYECIHYHQTPPKEQLIRDFERFHDVSAIYGSWLGFFRWGGFKGELAEKCLPSGLKALAVCTVGFNDYDGQLLAARGVVLTNVPADITGAAAKVADCVLYHAIESFRQFQLFSRSLNTTGDVLKARAVVDSDRFDATLGQPERSIKLGFSFGEQFGGRAVLSPRGHQAVIVGFGAIGQAIAERLNAIGMRIAIVKQSPLSNSERERFPYPLEQVTYTEGLQRADLLVFIVPGSPSTVHMLNEETLKFTRPGIRLINAGRGSAWDEKAIVKGLQSGHIGHVGMDVFEYEPAVEPGLFNRSDVFMTPRIGSMDQGTWNATAVHALGEIDRVLLGETPLSRVN